MFGQGTYITPRPLLDCGQLPIPQLPQLLKVAMSPFASVYGCVLVSKSAAHQTPGGPGTRGTNSWLDDTDKNFGSDLPLLLKMHKIWSTDSQKNH